ncbi:MAG: hypothetical protein Q7T44_17905 [Parvibaculum sp.]|nr:hypothetical protein [Parvibaculum sp.]
MSDIRVAVFAWSVVIQRNSPVPALSAALAAFRNVELLAELLVARLGCLCRFGSIRLPLLNMGMSLVEVLVGEDRMVAGMTDGTMGW